MIRTNVLAAVGIAAMVLVAGCSKDNGPTQPPSTAPAVPALSALPASVTVAVGAMQTVYISGGKPPYTIVGPPTASATASLLSPDSLIATLQITGVSVASVSTAVTVQDNSLSTAKLVTVPVKVQ